MTRFDDVSGTRRCPAAVLSWCRFATALAALILVPAVSTAQAPTLANTGPVLTLGAAVTEALERNPDALDAAQLVESARLAVRLANDRFTPKVVPSVLGSFAGTDLSNQMFGASVSQRFITGTQVDFSVSALNYRNQLGSYYNSDTTLRFTQPLLRGAGSAVNRRELNDAESRVRSAEAQKTVARREVALRVATAYLQVVTSTTLVDVTDKTLSRYRGLQEAAEAKLAAGIVSRLDLLRARQLVAQAEAQRGDALAAVEDAKDSLRVLMTRPPDWPFRVDAEPHTTGMTIGLDEATRTALDRSEEMRMAREALLQAERAVTLRRNQLLPQFELGAALTRYATAQTLRASLGLNDFHVAAFAGASVPLDRTGSKVDLQNAVFEREKLGRALDTISARIVIGTRQAFRQLERARQARQMAEAAVDLAREEADVASLRYQRGLSDNLDLVKAEADLLAADCRRVGALADLVLAELKMRAAIGVLNPGQDVR